MAWRTRSAVFIRELSHGKTFRPFAKKIVPLRRHCVWCFRVNRNTRAFAGKYINLWLIVILVTFIHFFSVSLERHLTCATFLANKSDSGSFQTLITSHAQCGWIYSEVKRPCSVRFKPVWVTGTTLHFTALHQCACAGHLNKNKFEVRKKRNVLEKSAWMKLTLLQCRYQYC